MNENVQTAAAAVLLIILFFSDMPYNVDSYRQLFSKLHMSIPIHANGSYNTEEYTYPFSMMDLSMLPDLRALEEPSVTPFVPAPQADREAAEESTTELSIEIVQQETTTEIPQTTVMPTATTELPETASVSLDRF